MPPILPPSRIALDLYLRRIDYDGDIRPSLTTLDALHLAHATHIPFENIDVLVGRGVDLSPEALQRKLIVGRRGGYCFEQNLLFATVLQDLGFDVTLLSARVRFGAPAGTVRARTHMVLLVTLEQGRWIADVGFGGEGLLRPVAFDPPGESLQFLWRYRIVPEGPLWVLQSARGDAWADMYAFTLDPHERVDYEVLNHYTATHPRSIFRTTLTAQLPSPERRLILRNRELSIDRGGALETRTLDDADIREVLRKDFGLDLPPSVTLPG